jgi:hypothetical protein
LGAKTRRALVRSTLLDGGGMAGIDRAALRREQCHHSPVAGTSVLSLTGDSEIQCNMRSCQDG